MYVSDQNVVVGEIKFKLAILKYSPHYQSFSLGSEQNCELMGYTTVITVNRRRRGFEPCK